MTNELFSPQSELTIMPPSALETMQKAEIDVQISTAHRFPRSMDRFLKNAVSMATIDEETSESCLYRRPVGKENGKTVYAEGMSVRMSEIVGVCYGNLRVYSTIIEQNERQVVARGMAIDLESNFAASSEVIESTITKSGAAYPERMRVVIAKAALAKARRDATFIVVPRALAKPVEAAVKRVLMGDAKTIERRRLSVISWVNKIGIDGERVWDALGVTGPADLNEEQLYRLTGLRTAIKDGDVSIDEAFPPIPDKPSIGKPKSPDKPAKKAKTSNPVEEEPDQEMPKSKATPEQAVQNLMKASYISESQLLKYVERETGESHQTIGSIDQGTLMSIIQAWSEIVSDITEGEK